MPDRPMLTAPALTTFNAFLPDGLDEKQIDKCLQAAGALAEVIWKDATAAAYVTSSMRGEARRQQLFDQEVERHRTVVARAEADERQAWADYIEQWGSEVGSPEFTPAAVAAALRAPERPFGVSAAQ